MSPTIKKRHKLLSMVNKFLNAKSCSIRDFAGLLGHLVSICMAVSYGFVYTKTMEREKFLSLQRSNNNFDEIMMINTEIKSDLLWWKANISSSFCEIKQYNFCLEIFSDASGSGWGSFCNGKTGRGFWSEQEKLYHINHLELLAAFFALKCFANDLKNCEILLRIDNTTAISYINRMGGVQFPSLSDLAKLIWKWCETRRLWVFASYIKSKDNTDADFESRCNKIDTEWELCHAAFQEIVKSFGSPHIDLFASRTNAKCKDYVSWHRDPFAYNIDAFTIRWTPHFFYAFPPFCLLTKVIQKIKNDRATGIVVYPVWPSQPWYPLLSSLITSDIVMLGPSESLLTSPFRTPHPMHAKLILGACILSGRHLAEG